MIDVDAAKARTIASNLFQCAAEAEELVAKGADGSLSRGQRGPDDLDKALAPYLRVRAHAFWELPAQDCCRGRRSRA